MEMLKRNNSHMKSKSIDLSISDINTNLKNSSYISNLPSFRSKKTSKIPAYLEKYHIEDDSLPFDEYSARLKGIMKEYKYEGILDDISSNIGALTIDLIDERHDKDKQLIKRVLSKNRRTLNMSRHSVNEDSIIKVQVVSEEYKNPFFSNEVLKKNNIIYQSVLLNHRERKDKKMKEYDKNKKKNNVIVLDWSKIKVTNLVPKMVDPSYASNPNPVKSDIPSLPAINSAHIESDISSTEMYGYYVYGSNSFPEGREQFCWCSEFNNYVLFGGITSNKSNNVWNLDPLNVEWTPIDVEGSNANLRYGHTGVLYQNKLYVFGGKAKLNNYTFFPDLEIFNLEDRNWISPPLQTKMVLKLRRNHIAKSIGHHMLIHGGISEDDEYLNDCFVLNFSPIKWQSLSINPDSEAPTLAWHSACLVLPSDQLYSNKLNIYKLPDIISRRISKIKEKGLYIFGGRSSEEGNFKNDVWVLRIGKKPLEWIKLKTNGTPPTPRCAHSMNFYEEGNYLIIHGGRNDSSSDSFALNDTYILELARFDWIKVKVYFDKPNVSVYNRCGHSSLIYSKNLISQFIINFYILFLIV